MLPMQHETGGSVQENRSGIRDPSYVNNMLENLFQAEKKKADEGVMLSSKSRHKDEF